MKFSCKNWVMFILAAGFWLCAGWLAVQASSAQAASRDELVRVCMYDSPGFQDFSTDGELSGYAVEYLLDMAKFSGWRYSFVKGTFTGCLQQVSDGAVDMMGGLRHGHEQRQLIYPDTPMGIGHLTLFTRADERRYTHTELSTFNGMRVAVLQRSAAIADLQRYFQEHALTLHVLPFTDRAAMLAALHKGEVDAILTTSLSRENGLRSLLRFAVRPFYFVMAPGREHLAHTFDAAAEQMFMTDREFDAALRHKYLQAASDTTPVFSAAEKEFIAQADVLDVYYNQEWEPFTIASPDGGAPEGIFPEIFAQVTRLSGLRFRFVPLPDSSEASRMMQRGNIALMSGMTHDQAWAAAQGMLLSRPCLTVPLVMISNTWPDDDRQHLVVLPEGSPLTPYAYKRFVAPEIRYLPSIRDCFDAVHTGKAEYTFVNSYIAREILAEPQFGNLYAVGFGGETMLSVGIRQDMDARLIAILDKSLNCISKEKITDIVLRHTVHFSPPSLTDVIYQYPLGSVAAALLVCGSIISLLLVLVVNSRRSARRISDMVNKDELTGAWSFIRFRREAARVLREAPHPPLVLIYCNINKFKMLNATYGYAAGDAALRFLCSLLSRHLRAGEMLARVHSDQFVCLLEYPGREAFEQRMRRILEELSNRGDERFDLTVTMGAYPLQADDTDINTVIDRANHARGQRPAGYASRLVLYDDALLAQVTLEKELEDASKQAMRSDEFMAYYQPKVDCRTGETVGAEALARWQREDGSMVSPGLFIPLFEKNGFITQLDFLICRKVCAQLAGGRPACAAGFLQFFPRAHGQ